MGERGRIGQGMGDEPGVDLLPRGGWFPESRYLTGLNEVNATYQYVSTGLGVDSDRFLPFRTCNPPQVSIITLTRKVDA